VLGGGVVANPNEAELRAALAGGGTVTFACDGTITLATTITNEVNTTVDASGHQITISGSNTVRVFYVATNHPQRVCFRFPAANLPVVLQRQCPDQLHKFFLELLPSRNIERGRLLTRRQQCIWRADE